MKKLTLLMVVAAFLFSASTPAIGAVENVQQSPWAAGEKSYVDRITEKLGFGILNVLTGWSALIYEPAKQQNFFSGLVKGAWRTVTNTAGGALHMATFPFPFDIPLPDGGVNFEG